MNAAIGALVELAHGLGRASPQLVILDEGSVSTRLEGGQFAVSTAQARLADLESEDVAVCQSAAVLSLLDRRTLPDALIEKALLESRVETAVGNAPTTDAVFHAWLLSLEGVCFVGHAHPVPAQQLLASPRARDFAEHRMFPGEIRHCGAASVYVPYADPGLALAWQVRERTRDYMRDHHCAPRLILLQNHGVIALGATPGAVLDTLVMTSKAAAVFAGAAAIGGPTFLLPQHIERLMASGASLNRATRPGPAGS